MCGWELFLKREKKNFVCEKQKQMEIFEKVKERREVAKKLFRGRESDFKSTEEERERDLNV